MTLTSGAQTYLYGEVGALGITPLAEGKGEFVKDTAGSLVVGVASASQPINSFSTLVSENSDMIGVGVSGFTNMQALYGKSVASGPGYVSSGSYQASVSFTIIQPTLVVAMGLGSSQQGITFQGPTGLITDATTNATNDVGIGRSSTAGIAHAYLDPGTYTITETTSIISADMTVDYIADLLGVYLFTNGTASIPQISGVNMTAVPVAGQSYDNWNMTIDGSGFGTQSPFNGDSSDLIINDTTQAFQAGYSVPNDLVNVNVTSWTDNQIAINGFTGAYGQPSNNGGPAWIILSGDQLQIKIANPQTGVMSSAFDTTVPQQTQATIPTNPGDTGGTIRIASGTGSFAGVSDAADTISVAAGASISGQVSLVTDNIESGGAVAPLIYTPSWGDPATSYQTINGWIPTGTSDQTASVSLTAPTTPGTYHIIFAFEWEMNGGQVASATNWASGHPDTWGDGNDIATLSQSQIQQGQQNGWTSDNWLLAPGYEHQYVPLDAITVVVGGGAPPAPIITGVSAAVPSTLQGNWSFTIDGRNLGTLASFSNKDTADLNLVDVTRHFSMGYTGDAVTVNVSSWSNNSIVISGLSGVYGGGQYVVNPGDQMSLEVLNPQTGVASNTFRFATPSTPPAPVITGVSTTVPSTVQGNWNFTINGNNLGTLAQAPFSNKDTADLNLVDVTRHFSVGYTGDAVTADVSAWSNNAITISGLAGAYDTVGPNGLYLVRPGDQMSVEVLNPQTLEASTKFTFIAAQSANPSESGPSITPPPISPVVEENSSLTFSAANGDAITLADPQAIGLNEQLNITASGGTVSLANTGQLDIMKDTGESETVVGSLSALNAALADGLVFTPTPGTSGSANINLTLTNLAVVENGSLLTATAKISVSILPPVTTTITAPHVAVIGENSQLSFTGGDAVTVSSQDTTSQGDKLTVNLDSAEIGLQGTLHFGASPGSSTWTVTGTPAEINLDLQGLTFSPNSDSTGTVYVTFSFEDSTDNVSATASTKVVVGLTPAQMNQAYGFNQLGFGNDANGNPILPGTGQTIAIINWGTVPTIYSDVNAFDAALGVPGGSAGTPETNGQSGFLTVVNQNGTMIDPSNVNYSGGSDEQALDVEWAHAIAPGAKIILVESSSSSWSDLNNIAIPNVINVFKPSVVSMSIGVGEFASEGSYDSTFASYPNVAFVGTSGDTYGQAGVGYPSVSPYVLSVGGTSLTVADAAGDYGSETPWSVFLGSGTGFGNSKYENEPSYQVGVTGINSGGMRATPDVAYDATGLPTYYDGWWLDTSPYGNAGTSYGAPQWAALIAIADQKRLENGLTTTLGGQQVMDALYSAPASDFHEPTPVSPSTALNRYNKYAGLGSPIANKLISYLASYSPHLTINATFGSSITGSSSAASTIEGDINSAISFYEQDLSNPITVNIYFNLGTDMGNTIASTVASYQSVSYSTYTQALLANATYNPSNVVEQTAYDNLQYGNDANGAASIIATSANLRALGRPVAGDLTSTGSQGGTYDGVILLNADDLAGFGQSGTYSANAEIQHEVDEVLGIGGQGSTLGPVHVGSGSYGPMDLFRYSAERTPSFTHSGTASSYFSIDGGNTPIVSFNQQSGGDYGDWGSNTKIYVQDAFGTPGANPTVSLTSPEGIALQAIGYDAVVTAAASLAPTTVTAANTAQLPSGTAVGGDAFPASLALSAWSPTLVVPQSDWPANPTPGCARSDAAETARMLSPSRLGGITFYFGDTTKALDKGNEVASVIPSPLASAASWHGIEPIAFRNRFNLGLGTWI